MFVGLLSKRPGSGTTSKKHGALRVVERFVWGYGGASSVLRASWL